MTPLKRALRVDGRQKSLITTDQTLAEGLTPEQIEGLIANGHWIRVVIGLYRINGATWSFAQDARAATLVSGPNAYGAGLTAGYLYGLAGISQPTELEVAVGATKSGLNRLARVHRLSELPKRDTAWVQGVPALHPVRLLIELATSLPQDRLCDAVDDAVIRRLARLERIEQRAAELGRRPGRPALMSVLASWGDDMPDSLANKRLARLLVSQGIAEPRLEYDVIVGGVFIGRLDLAWPEDMSGYEVQSKKHHAGPRKMELDIVRRRRFKAVGWEVHEATPAEIRALDVSLATPLQHLRAA